MSAFRRRVLAVLTQHAHPEPTAQAVADLLRARGFPIRRGWCQSRLVPGLASVRERSVGDRRWEALEVCRLLAVDLGLDLVGRGLLAHDPKALAWLKRGHG